MTCPERKPGDENVPKTVLGGDFPEDDDVDRGRAVEREDATMKAGRDVWMHEYGCAADDATAAAVDEVVCGGVVD